MRKYKNVPKTSSKFSESYSAPKFLGILQLFKKRKNILNKIKLLIKPIPCDLFNIKKLIISENINNEHIENNFLSNNNLQNNTFYEKITFFFCYSF